MTKTTIALLVLLLTIACSKPDHFTLSGMTMGTHYHITVVDADIDSAALQTLVDQQLLASNQTFSTYIDDSELSQLNRAPAGEKIAVSEDLLNVLVAAQQVAELSNGAFDSTIGPVVDLWGFGPTPMVDQPPSEQALTDALNQVGYQHLILQLPSSTVLKQQPLQIDLSAIAKGYAVDQLAELLSNQGIQNFLVDIGGELRLTGHNPRGTPWRIAIEDPQGGVERALSVTNRAMATSGDYRNYFEHDGERYSHTIDPRTGKPIDHSLASVTVIADTALWADAMATAINVLGVDAGLQLAEQQQLAVYLIIKTTDGFSVRYSTAFTDYL